MCRSLIRPSNIGPLWAVARDNFDFTKYLIGQVLQTSHHRFAALQDYYPRAKSADWELEVEGQRVQIIKPDPKRGGFLEFGTELVAAADHSLVALLGASPGADGGFHLDRRPREVLQGRIGSERLASQAQGHDPILWLVADRKRRPVPARPRRNRGRATPGICLNIDLGRRCRGPPSFGADVFR